MLTRARWPLLMTRREILMQTGRLAALSALGVQAKALSTPLKPDEQAKRKMKVMVSGGHPGDPECGCAGTIARYTDLGHEVVILYLNRGQGYCGQRELKECGGIRTSEAEKACSVLKARAAFARQYDGRAIVDGPHYEELRKQLELEKPDVVFTQWPIDAHRDHRAISAMVLDAWLQSEKKFALYYYEVAEDTMMFVPTEYVDISGVETQRHAACYAHASQSPEKWYPLQTEITRSRGTQGGYKQAEAFVRQLPGAGSLLP
jgi:LmbE family N-acetylglucosaminyl deacetylase